MSAPASRSAKGGNVDKTEEGSVAKAVAEGLAKVKSGKPSMSKTVDAGGTAIASCVRDELGRYFDMLDGEKPSGLYRMVIRQAEHALLSAVMRECGGNQSKAAEWLGISRGNLRNKLAEME
ncbi:helix-turn-helix domain-containing protein [Granulosicoccus antarcticus]|nr:helix-turn-helix domain-containing protein [Granulosicoccus antarcticus]